MAILWLALIFFSVFALFLPLVWYACTYAISFWMFFFLYQYVEPHTGSLIVLLLVPLFFAGHFIVKGVSLIGGLVSLAVASTAAYAAWIAAGDIMPGMAEIFKIDGVGAFVLYNKIGCAVTAFFVMGGLHIARPDPVLGAILMATGLWKPWRDEEGAVKDHPIQSNPHGFIVTMNHPSGGGFSHAGVDDFRYDLNGHRLTS